MAQEEISYEKKTISLILIVSILNFDSYVMYACVFLPNILTFLWRSSHRYKDFHDIWTKWWIAYHLDVSFWCFSNKSTTDRFQMEHIRPDVSLCAHLIFSIYSPSISVYLHKSLTNRIYCLTQSLSILWHYRFLFHAFSITSSLSRVSILLIHVSLYFSPKRTILINLGTLIFGTFNFRSYDIFKYLSGSDGSGGKCKMY